MSGIEGISEPARLKTDTTSWFRSGGGEAGAILRAKNWSSTPLGRPEDWPVALKTLVGVMLGSNQPMFLTWGERRTLLYNDAYSEILASKHPEAMGRDFLDVWEEIRGDLLPIVDKAYRGEPVQMDDIELWMERKGFREEAHFAFSYTPVRDESGDIAGFFCACQEITGQVIADRKLRESEARAKADAERVRLALDAGAIIGTWFYDIPGDSFTVDEQFASAFGIDPALGRSGLKLEQLLDNVHPDDKPGLIAAVEEVISRGGPYAHQYRVRRADGNYYWIEANGRVEKAEDGTPLKFPGVLLDVEDRRKTEIALRASEEFNRRVLASSADCIKVLDLDGRLEFMSQGGLGVMEVDNFDAIRGVPWIDFWQGDEKAKAESAVEEAKRGGTGRFRGFGTTMKGSSRWWDVVVTPINGPAGQPEKLLSVSRDSTEMMNAEAALRETSRRLDAILNNTRQAVFLMDHRQHCVYANAAAEMLTRHRFEEMQGRPLHDVIHHKKPDGSHYPIDECPIDRAFPERAQVSGEELFVAPDGAFYPVAFTASPLLDDDGKPVGTVIEARNIAEEKQRDEALQDQARTLETINRTGAAVAAELDLERVVQTVTDAGVELTGAQFGAFFYNVMNDAGESLMLYTLSGADRSDFEGFGMPRATAVFKPTFFGEGVIRSDDILADPRYGKSAPHYGMPEGHLPVRSYLAVPVTSRSGEVLGGLFFGHPEPGRFLERHEQLMIGIAAQAAVAVDNARLFQAAQRELEDRRRAEAALRDLNDTLEQRVHDAVREREKAQDALRQSQKMEAVGQLVSGLAHDFNNLLGAVIGALELINRKPEDPERVRRFALAGLQAADRGSKLTGQLLAFSRSQRIELKPLLVCDVIEGLRDMLSRTLGPMIDLKFDLNPAPVPVLADPTQVEMTVLNLAINARDAMPEGGTLRIATATRRIDHDPELPAGDYVELTVSDTGFGMDEPTLRRAMEPFFTTKPLGKGTGLGLAQVYGSARQSGGTARIDSEVGQGTTVRVLLPRTEAAAEEPGRSDAAARACFAPGTTVLVVDDDDDLRGVLVNSLDALGYRPTEAADAASAITMIEKRCPDVMVVDFAMPGMNGAELARIVGERWPGIAVVLASGYADSDAVEKAVGQGVKVLRKPFRIDELLGAVAETIRNRDEAMPPVLE